MSDLALYRNLCCRIIRKRVLPGKGWKQFDIFSEIASLNLSLTA